MKSLLNRLDADAAAPGSERHKRPEDRDPLGALRAIDLNVIAAAAANDDHSLSGRSNEPNLAELRAFLAQGVSTETDGEGFAAGAAPHEVIAAAPGLPEGYGLDPAGRRDGDLPKVVASVERVKEGADGEVLKRINSNPVAVRTVAAEDGFAGRALRPLKLAVAVSVPLCLGVAYVAAGWLSGDEVRALRDVPAGAAAAHSGGLAGGLAVASTEGFDLATLLLPALEPRSADALSAGASKAASTNAASSADNAAVGKSGSGPVVQGDAHQPVKSSYITDASGKRRILVDATAGETLALPVELGPASATAEVGALVVRGLPDSFSITGASAAGDGSWVLAPQELQTARVVVPGQAAGEVDVEISLFDFAAVEVGLMNLRLKISARTIDNGIGTAGLESSRQNLDPDRARALLDRGRALLELGDVAAARLLLERAAEGGEAQAALLVGETYDPVRLAMRGVVGSLGSVETAKGWYRRALAQGVDEAQAPLAMLASFKAREEKPTE